MVTNLEHSVRFFLNDEFHATPVQEIAACLDYVCYVYGCGIFGDGNSHVVAGASGHFIIQ